MYILIMAGICYLWFVSIPLDSLTAVINAMMKKVLIISLAFLYQFIFLWNLNSYALSIQAGSTETCTPSSSGSIYPVMLIQITDDFAPGVDDSPAASQTTGNARAINAGSISSDSDVIGNVFSFVPPAGAKFVILSGFEDPTNTNQLSSTNATITATSRDSGNPGVDDFVGIRVGVVTSGSAGIGRAIVAIARDADTTGHIETLNTYGRGTISING